MSLNGIICRYVESRAIGSSLYTGNPRRRTQSLMANPFSVSGRINILGRGGRSSEDELRETCISGEVILAPSLPTIPLSPPPTETRVARGSEFASHRRSLRPRRNLDHERRDSPVLSSFYMYLLLFLSHSVLGRLTDRTN